MVAVVVVVVAGVIVVVVVVVTGVVVPVIVLELSTTFLRNNYTVFRTHRRSRARVHFR